jgi:phospholipid N-methyltransferase
MNIKETMLFFRGALSNIREVGSVMPSSPVVARAMTAALRQGAPPRRILEVGAGTGPITARIVREMRAGDRLDVYEVNADFSRYLARRFEREAPFRSVQEQVTIHTAGIESIERVPAYDVIISAIPFTAFPPAAVEEFFEIYRAILKPGGSLTYIEFAFGRALLRAFAKRGEKERLQKVDYVVNSYVRRHQFGYQFVPLNLPPARIRTLRFDHSSSRA